MAFPLVELALLVKVAGTIGFWKTIGIIIGTALLGLMILSRQGLNTLGRATDAMAAGRMPFEPLTDGALLLLAGALLIAPGLITDTLGLLLLIPPVRRLMIRWGFARINPANIFRDTPGDSPRRPKVEGDGPVIEGEYERLNEHNTDKANRRDPRERS